MRYQIQVINVEQVSGTSKNGPYSFQKLHCIIETESDPIIGVLIPPKGIDNVGKGTYVAEFGLAVDREQRVIGQLKSLTPVQKSSHASPQKAA